LELRGLGCGVWGEGCGVLGEGCGVWCLGGGVLGLGFEVSGFVFRVSVVRFRVSGVRFRISGLWWGAPAPRHDFGVGWAPFPISVILVLGVYGFGCLILPPYYSQA